MREFVKNLLSDSGTVSSKRFISLFSLLLFTVVTIAVLAGYTVPNELIYSLVTLIAGTSALTTIPTAAPADKNKIEEDKNQYSENK